MISLHPYFNGGITEAEKERWYPEADFDKLRREAPAEFVSLISSKLNRLLDERIAPFIRLYQSYFDALEEGYIHRRTPSLDEPVCSQKQADEFVLNLEYWFKKQLYMNDTVWSGKENEVKPYWRKRGIDSSPGFDRMVGTPAAVGLWQDVQRLKRKAGLI